MENTNENKFTGCNGWFHHWVWCVQPVMLWDEKLATAMAARILEEGVYVIGFTYPVVPKGQARIRVQITAAHTREQLETAVAAFIKVRSEMV